MSYCDQLLILLPGVLLLDCDLGHPSFVYRRDGPIHTGGHFLLDWIQGSQLLAWS